MKTRFRHKGFSLTEVLLAVSVLAVGMTFVAGVFPVAIHYSTISTERTKAAIITDEAFAKIKLIANDPACKIYSTDFNDLDQSSFREVVKNKRIGLAVPEIDPDEFAYPSAYTDLAKQYYWAALCKDLGNESVQVTVFVCRKTGAASVYPDPADPHQLSVPYPSPVRLAVSAVAGMPYQLSIDTAGAGEYPETFVNDGYTIIDDISGLLYRVLQRSPTGDNDKEIIVLDKDWLGGSYIWVIPPAVNGSRNPCIAVYQKVIGIYKISASGGGGGSGGGGSGGGGGK